MSKSNAVTVKNIVRDAGKVFVQDVNCGELVIETIKAKNAPMEGDFLPASVRKGQTVVWKFQVNHPGYREQQRGMAKLADINGELIIYLHRGKLLDAVIPVRHTPTIQWISSDLFTGGLKRAQLVALKQTVAEQFNLDPVWTEVDQQFLTHVAQKRHEERERERLAEEAAKAERHRLRTEKAQTIMARPVIKAFTTNDNAYRKGTPVVGDEWQSVQANTLCISVASYDETTGKVGDVLEAFRVVMKGSRKVRVQVSAVKPYTTSSTLLTVESTLPKFTMTTVVVEDEVEDALLVATSEDVKALRDAGYRNMYAQYTGKNGAETVFITADGGINSVSKKKLAA